MFAASTCTALRQTWLSGLTLVMLSCLGCTTHPNSSSQAVLTASSSASHATLIQTTAYSPQVLWSDGGWNGITVASNNQIYVALASHSLEHHGIILRFDPATQQFHGVADLGQITKTPAGPQGFVPQGKIHTPFFEHEGYLYFATHVGAVAHSVTSQRKPYPGGQFLRINLKDHQAQSLGTAPNGQGIITLIADFPRQKLYGLTWPSSDLLLCDLATQQVRNLGPTETFFHPATKERDAYAEVCRSLALDPQTGRVYGTRVDGAIYIYDPAADQLQFTPVNLTPTTTAPTTLPATTIPAKATQVPKHHWRTIAYDPTDRCFYGVQEDSVLLFRLNPRSMTITPLTQLLPQSMRPTPEAARLAMVLGPNRILWQIIHGPGIEYDGRPKTKYQTYLVSYDLNTGKLTEHGALVASRRRVLYSDSLAIAADGNLWCLAMLELTDPLQTWLLDTQRRGIGSYIHIGGTPFEMQLIAIPLQPPN